MQATSTAVFDNLQQVLTEFINEHQWTQLNFRRSERIACSFNFTVQKYDEADHKLECALTVSATRPVYNASYTTTTFSTRDGNCNFRFQEFDKLEFRPEAISLPAAGSPSTTAKTAMPLSTTIWTDAWSHSARCNISTIAKGWT